MIFDKEAKEIQWNKVLSTNAAGTTGYPHAKNYLYEDLISFCTEKETIKKKKKSPKKPTHRMGENPCL